MGPVPRLLDRLSRPVGIEPLVGFRVLFGALMAFNAGRYWAYGWIDAFYIDPAFHFTYRYFAWVAPLPGYGMHAVFAALIALGLGIALGLYYRFCAAAFLLLFTYVQLLDKTYYLNHYYLAGLLALLCLFLPLHRAASLDARRRPGLRQTRVPRWTLWLLRFQIGLVYFFAGVAKLQGDWLLRAQPLKIWLAASADLPLAGTYFQQAWVAYAMAWAGMLFDLSAPFLLAWRRTRVAAFALAVLFHLATFALFNIGIFPWLMIAGAALFFEPRQWRRVVRLTPSARPPRPLGRPGLLALGLYAALQVLLPLRHWAYPGDLLWTEEGFRFAWQVMVAEKTGAALFTAVHPPSGRRWTVHPGRYLTPVQEGHMAFQPDMVRQFARFAAARLRPTAGGPVEVRADVRVSLNGRASRPLVDPQVDLAARECGRRWILPFEKDQSAAKIRPDRNAP